MQLNVYTVSFSGILIVRDEDGKELSRRVATAPKTVTVAAADQKEAVEFAEDSLPDGQEINVNHVVQMSSDVAILGATRSTLYSAAMGALIDENDRLKAELELTQKAFAASQQKPAEPPTQPAAVEPETHPTNLLGTAAEPPLDEQLKELEIPKEFSEPKPEGAQGSESAAS